MSTTTPSALPAVIERFVAAVNAFDTDAIVATFTEDALINDVSREFAGLKSFRSFIEHELVADKVTMKVGRTLDHHGDVVLDAAMDGIYDKTGLPDPLVLTFYFAVRGERITQLIIVHNKPAVVRKTR